MAEKKSKILIIGGTGYIGKFIVEASAKSGHPTFALVRESTLSDPVKGEIIQNFRNLGVTLVHGDLYNHDSLLKAIKQVDVVISAVGLMQIADQVKIIAAIKEAGNIKRFFPSEFGDDSVPPFKSTSEKKAQIRRAIEAEGIPYTYVVSDAVFNKEDYIATYTIRVVDDPSALNKILNADRAINVKKTPEITEEQILKYIKEAPFNFELSINHSVEIKGNHTKLEDLFKGWLSKVGELLSEREEQIATLKKKCSDLEAESAKNAEKVVELTDEKNKLTQDLTQQVASEGQKFQAQIASLRKENNLLKEKLKKIDEASVFTSLIFILGVAFVSAVIGIVLGKRY